MAVLRLELPVDQLVLQWLSANTVDNAAWRAQIGADTSGNLLIGPTVLDATAGFLARVTVWNTSTCAPVSTGFTLNNSAGAMGCTLPTITSANVGLQLCFRNSVTRTGAITLTVRRSTHPIPYPCFAYCFRGWIPSARFVLDKKGFKLEENLAPIAWALLIAAWLSSPSNGGSAGKK